MDPSSLDDDRFSFCFLFAPPKTETAHPPTIEIINESRERHEAVTYIKGTVNSLSSDSVHSRSHSERSRVFRSRKASEHETRLDHLNLDGLRLGLER
jgi:hypothetical protein